MAAAVSEDYSGFIWHSEREAPHEDARSTCISIQVEEEPRAFVVPAPEPKVEGPPSDFADLLGALAAEYAKVWSQRGALQRELQRQLGTCGASGSGTSALSPPRVKLPKQPLAEDVVLAAPPDEILAHGGRRANLPRHVHGAAMFSDGTGVTEVSECSPHTVRFARTSSSSLEPTPSRKRHVFARPTASCGMSRLASFDVVALEDIVATRRRDRWKEQLWGFLVDPASSSLALLYHRVQNPIIFASFLFILIRMIAPDTFSDVVGLAGETTFEVLFTLDILMRLLLCPDRGMFVRNRFNWVDAWAVPCLVLRVALWGRLGDPYIAVASDVVFLGINPVMRLLKLLRRFQKCLLVFSAFADASEALPMLLYMLLMLIVTGTVLMYFLEPRSNIDSFATAMWFVVVTMMTVGYGDLTPSTGAGKVAATGIMLATAMYMAIPIGIIGNCFNRVWEDRHTFIVIKKTAQRLLQWGYDPWSVSKLFKLFDAEKEGELTFREFKKMMQHMNIGLKEQEILEIFETFDRDGSGTVDDKEFVKAVFPGFYHLVYFEGDDDDAPRTHSGGVLKIVSRFPSFFKQADGASPSEEGQPAEPAAAAMSANFSHFSAESSSRPER